MTLMMTSAQVVETSVNVTNNSPARDYSHPDDQTTQTTETPGFKPFTVLLVVLAVSLLAITNKAVKNLQGKLKMDCKMFEIFTLKVFRIKVCMLAY